MLKHEVILLGGLPQFINFVAKLADNENMDMHSFAINAAGEYVVVTQTWVEE